jgi:hypothetical protein
VYLPDNNIDRLNTEILASILHLYMMNPACNQAKEQASSGYRMGRRETMKRAFVPLSMLPLIISFLMSSCASFPSKQFMSWEDYVRQPRSNPYILELERHGGSLVYYGAFHKVDPAHPQFADIENKWEDFRPTLAYCEGSLWPLEESRIKAIENYGEQGLVTFLAARDGIDIECIDPSLTEQAAHLRQLFPANIITIYYVMRQAAINRMLKKDIPPSKYAVRYFKKFRRLEGFHHSPSNLDEFERMVSILFPELKEWQEIPYSYFHCRKLGRIIASIHRELNEYRNQIMVKKVVQALKKGQKVFAIVGRSHVVIQEAILKSTY